MPLPNQPVRRITSPGNSLLKQLRLGFAQSGDGQGGLVAIEGVRLLEEALRSGLKAHAVFFREPLPAAAARVLEQVGHKAEAVSLPAALFNRAVPSESPQGVAALITRRASTWEEILAPPQALILALAGVQDPGNAGTLLRAAEAFGAAGVLLLEGTASASNPKLVRAAAGSLFRLPLMKTEFSQALPRLREKRIRMVAGSSHNGATLDQADLSPPLCLMVGNEGAGIPRAMLAEAQAVVRIPHAPQVESLNAALAGAVMMYEIARRRDSGAPA